MQDEAETEDGRGVRVLMSVDDAGDYLLCTGPSLVVGHARGARADLPLLADLGPEHAVLERRVSLATGAEWYLVPQAGERVSRNAEPVRGDTVLADGDELRLGANLELRFRQPDAASETAVVDLPGGVDCLGAGHVVLFAPGPAGRLRVGARGGRHVRVPNLDPGFELRHAAGTLVVASAAGVASAGARGDSLSLPFPPSERVYLSIGAPRAAGRPPFSFSLVRVDG